jgi:hypothetical protein
LSEKRLTLYELDEARARFEATLRVGPMEDLFRTAVLSSCDVPDLVTEIYRLRARWQILQAACLAGLGVAVENDPRPLEMWFSDSPWAFVTDALPMPPGFHPLAQCIPARRWGGQSL